MALHGEIKVNHQVLGWWEAVRGNPVDLIENTFVYLCTVAIEGREPHKFVLVHPVEDGALGLASKVLMLAWNEDE